MFRGHEGPGELGRNKGEIVLSSCGNMNQKFTPVEKFWQGQHRYTVLLGCRPKRKPRASQAACAILDKGVLQHAPCHFALFTSLSSPYPFPLHQPLFPLSSPSRTP
jgi:hypothetical protein